MQFWMIIGLGSSFCNDEKVTGYSANCDSDVTVQEIFFFESIISIPWRFKRSWFSIDDKGKDEPGKVDAGLK